MGRRENRRNQLLDGLKEATGYWKLNEKALWSRSVDWLWQRLSSCRKTDYEMNVYHNRYRREMAGLFRGVLEIFVLPRCHTTYVGRWMPTSNLPILTYLCTYLISVYGVFNSSNYTPPNRRREWIMNWNVWYKLDLPSASCLDRLRKTNKSRPTTVKDTTLQK